MGDSSLRVLGAGVVNDPANKSLRFDMLKFGLDRFCDEMMKARRAAQAQRSGAGAGPLFRRELPVAGPRRGNAQVVRACSTRARATPGPTSRGKLGFSSRGLVEYAPDFQLSDGALYVYFRPKTVDAAAFQLLSVDSALAQAGIAAAAGT